MNIDAKDISTITRALEEQIEEICERQVRQAVSEIPFVVRKLVDEEFSHSIRDRVRKALQRNLNVDVKVTTS